MSVGTSHPGAPTSRGPRASIQQNRPVSFADHRKRHGQFRGGGSWFVGGHRAGRRRARAVDETRVGEALRWRGDVVFRSVGVASV